MSCIHIAHVDVYTYKQKKRHGKWIACGHVKTLRLRMINIIIDAYIYTYTLVTPYAYRCVYFLFVSAEE